MSLTAAERQRRSRAHRAGDHSLCDPSRDCDLRDVTPLPGAPDVPASLGRRGRRLWLDVTSTAELVAADQVLLEEACRTADRLDKLDHLLTGSALDWIGIVESKGDPDRQEVVIDRPLAEARQQQLALKQLLAELRQQRAATARPAQTTPSPEPVVKGGGDVPAGTIDFAAALATKGRRPATG